MVLTELTAKQLTEQRRQESASFFPSGLARGGIANSGERADWTRLFGV